MMTAIESVGSATPVFEEEMAIKHQAQRVTTSMGLKARRDPLCHTCRQRIAGDVLMTIDPNGNPICPTCMGDGSASPCTEADCGCSSSTAAVRSETEG